MHKVITLFTALCCTSAIAEFRIWSDQKGNHIEAEYVCETAGRTVLRTADGKEMKVPTNKLSEKDQKYIEALIPPKLNISFKKDVDRRKTGDYSTRTTENIVGIVTIKKTSRRPYTYPLRAEMYIIGEDTRYNEYTMLAVEKDEFKFDESSGDEFSMVSERINTYQYESYSGYNHGTEYEGYAVVVLDRDDNIIDIQASRKLFEEKIDLLRKVRVRQDFDKDLKYIKKSKSSSSKYSSGYSK